MRYSVKSFSILCIYVTILIIGQACQMSAKKKFTQDFYAMLSNELDSVELVSMEELVIITSRDDREFSHYLDNAYAEYLLQPETREVILADYVKASLELYDPPTQVDVNRIVPVIKDGRYLDELYRINDNKELDFLYEHYNNQLYILYAQDLPNSISYLKIKDVAALGINRDSLLDLAVSNLNELMPEIKRHGGDGSYMVTAGGYYEASLILDRSLWSQDNFPVNGQIVVAIPSRDLILVTGSDDHQNLEELQKTIREVNVTGGHLVSTSLFILRNDKFQEFIPEAHMR